MRCVRMCVSCLMALALLSWIPAGAAELPKLLSATTYTVGSTGYAISMGLCKAIEEKGGIKVKVVPAGTDVSKLKPVMSKEMAFSILTGAGQFMASRGLGLFAAPSMGPQKLRLLWACDVGAIAGMMARGDAGIKTLSDLKGRRVSMIPGSPACTFLHSGYLAFGGLTTKDVKIVKVSSWRAAWKAVLEGSADTAHCLVTSSAAVELAASPHGIAWLPAPASDKAGWKRLNSWCPYLRPYLAKKGAGVTPEKPAQIASYYYGFVTYPFLAKNVAQTITKSIYNGYDIYKDMHAALKLWTRKAALNNGAFVVPYHAGSVAAFKAAGAWSAEHAKIQKSLLQAEKKRIQAYQAARKLAKQKNVSEKEWPSFWEKYAREKSML